MYDIPVLKHSKVKSVQSYGSDRWTDIQTDMAEIMETICNLSLAITGGL